LVKEEQPALHEIKLYVRAGVFRLNGRFGQLEGLQGDNFSILYVETLRIYTFSQEARVVDNQLGQEDRSLAAISNLTTGKGSGPEGFGRFEQHTLTEDFENMGAIQSLFIGRHLVLANYFSKYE